MSQSTTPVPEEWQARFEELEGQVRRLVRTEQRLVLSQRDLSRQLARFDALNQTAARLAAAVDPAAALMHAADLVVSIFAYDQCVAFEATATGLRVAAVRAAPGREADASCEIACSIPVNGEARPSVPLLGDAESVGEAAAGLAPLLDVLEQIFASDSEPPRASTPAMLLPIAEAKGTPIAYLAFRRVSGKLGYHDELPSPDDVPFLQLVGQQVAAAVTQQRLVADLKQRNELLAKAQRDRIARERLAALGELAAVVAHEVRNPLAVIFNVLALLGKRPPKNAEEQTLIEIIGQESQRLNQIVHELLDFARPRATSFRPECLLAVTLDALDDAQTMVEPEELDVRVEAHGAIPPVHGDARMLRQIVLNLVLNAHHSSRTPGPIVVALSTSDGDAPFVKLDVIDQGAGIEAENLARVFDPFFTTKPCGSGLGLTVVRRFAELHKGSVSVRSEAGAGSTFTVRLPAVA